MNRITAIASARFSNLVARRIPALGRTATARQVEKYRRIPVAVLERRNTSDPQR